MLELQCPSRPEVNRRNDETIPDSWNPSVPRGPKLDGEQEAKVIALRLGAAPEGYANWTLRLLQSKVVELSIVDSISPETLRQSLKKMA